MAITFSFHCIVVMYFYLEFVCSPGAGGSTFIYCIIKSQVPTVPPSDSDSGSTTGWPIRFWWPVVLMLKMHYMCKQLLDTEWHLYSFRGLFVATSCVPLFLALF